MDKKRGIGRNGRLPWELSVDMRFFREITTCPDRNAVESRYGFNTASAGAPIEAADFLAKLKSAPALPHPTPDRRNAVLMGRNTWEALPPVYKPLPNRLNGVLSRREGNRDETGTHRIWPSLEEALKELGGNQSVAEIFVIGGAQIYAEALLRSDCARIYLTEIEAEFPCDVFFPAWPEDFRITGSCNPVSERGVVTRFLRYERGLS